MSENDRKDIMKRAAYERILLVYTSTRVTSAVAILTDSIHQ